MPASIAIFGGSFNPPGRHHRHIVLELAKRFDQVLVVPCGPRPDKPVINDVTPLYRAAMAEMTFGDIKKVQLDFFDLRESTFTRTWELQERFAERGQVWHVVGSDLVKGGQKQSSVIQKEWSQGQWIFAELNFVVVRRPGFELNPDDLPPHAQTIDVIYPGSSSDIRDRIFQHRSFKDQVVPQVAAYIERHNLYRGMQPSGSTKMQLDEIRPNLIVDEDNPQAQRIVSESGLSQSEDPNLNLVIGGDGTMLRAIRSFWSCRLPFYGVNAGHMGFLLNRNLPQRFLKQALVVEQLPLLSVEVQNIEGRKQQTLAFNDAWVERATGQTAWLQVKIDNQVRLEPLIADGALVATAAGSTSYARAMGAQPLPVNTPALLLVGSNVLKPAFWRPVVMPLDAVVLLTTLDPHKRPLLGYIDGVSVGEIVSLKVQVSRYASVELVFEPDHQPAHKLARIQFPLEPVD